MHGSGFPCTGAALPQDTHSCCQGHAYSWGTGGGQARPGALTAAAVKLTEVNTGPAPSLTAACNTLAFVTSVCVTGSTDGLESPRVMPQAGPPPDDSTGSSKVGVWTREGPGRRCPAGTGHVALPRSPHRLGESRCGVGTHWTPRCTWPCSTPAVSKSPLPFLT